MNGSRAGNEQFLLSFSGIDGAGKSTQIFRLQKVLEQAVLRVELITFWDDVATLRFLREEASHKVFKGDRGVGSPQAPIRRLDKNVRSPFLTLFRLALYALDALSLRRVVKKLRRGKAGARADVIIFDRYIYDELANLCPGNLLTRVYISALLPLIPKPNLAFVLDADPDAAFARKPEYPLEFLHTNRDAYLSLARMAGMTVIPPASIDEAHIRIRRLVQQATDSLRPEIHAEGKNEDVVISSKDKRSIDSLEGTEKLPSLLG